MDSKLGLSSYLLCDHEQVTLSLQAPVSPLLYPFDNVRVLSCFSCVQLFAALWTVAHSAPLSVQFSRQEHSSGLPRPPPGDLPNQGIEPISSLVSPAIQVDSLPSEPPAAKFLQSCPTLSGLKYARLPCPSLSPRVCPNSRLLSQ